MAQGRAAYKAASPGVAGAGTDAGAGAGVGVYAKPADGAAFQVLGLIAIPSIIPWVVVGVDAAKRGATNCRGGGGWGASAGVGAGVVVVGGGGGEGAVGRVVVDAPTINFSFATDHSGRFAFSGLPKARQSCVIRASNVVSDARTSPKKPYHSCVPNNIPNHPLAV
jgi:hypothetical protein